MCRSLRRAALYGHGSSAAPEPAASTRRPCGRPSAGSPSVADSSSGDLTALASTWPIPPTSRAAGTPGRPHRKLQPETRRKPMTERSVIHDTFVIERTYPASPSRVFAAFAAKEAKDAWGDTGDIAGTEPATGPAEFDFRAGGHERFGMVYQGVDYTYDACYYDIVPDQRLVYSYEMYADGARISVSVATVEFVKAADGTTL